MLSTLGHIWEPADSEEAVFTCGASLSLPLLHSNTFQIIWKKKRKQLRAGPVFTTVLEHNDGQTVKWLAKILTLPILFIIHCLKYHSKLFGAFCCFPDLSSTPSFSRATTASFWKKEAAFMIYGICNMLLVCCSYPSSDSNHRETQNCLFNWTWKSTR